MQSLSKELLSFWNNMDEAKELAAEVRQCVILGFLNIV